MEVEEGGEGGEGSSHGSEKLIPAVRPVSTYLSTGGYSDRILCSEDES